MSRYNGTVDSKAQCPRGICEPQRPYVQPQTQPYQQPYQQPYVVQIPQLPTEGWGQKWQGQSGVTQTQPVVDESEKDREIERLKSALQAKEESEHAGELEALRLEISQLKQQSPAQPQPPDERTTADSTRLEGITQAVESHKQDQQEFAAINTVLSTVGGATVEEVNEKIEEASDLLAWIKDNWLSLLIVLIGGAYGGNKLVDSRAEKKAIEKNPTPAK